MSTFESLSSDEQKRILDEREERGKKRKEADKQAMDTVSSQSRGVKYLKDRRIGLNPEQKGDIGSLIQRWLIVSQRSIQHTQDSKRGTRNLERIKKFFYSKYVPTLETFPREEFLRVQEEANLAQGRGRITNQLTSEQINQGIEIEINNV